MAFYVSKGKASPAGPDDGAKTDNANGKCPSPVPAGASIEVLWPPENTWYHAVVIEAYPGNKKFHVYYPATHEQEDNVPAKRVRVIDAEASWFEKADAESDGEDHSGGNDDDNDDEEEEEDDDEVGEERAAALSETPLSKWARNKLVQAVVGELSFEDLNPQQHEELSPPPSSSEMVSLSDALTQIEQQRTPTSQSDMGKMAFPTAATAPIEMGSQSAGSRWNVGPPLASGYA
eukprot:g2821.t1